MNNYYFSLISGLHFVLNSRLSVKKHQESAFVFVPSLNQKSFRFYLKTVENFSNKCTEASTAALSE